MGRLLALLKKNPKAVVVTILGMIALGAVSYFELRSKEIQLIDVLLIVGAITWLVFGTFKAYKDK